MLYKPLTTIPFHKDTSIKSFPAVKGMHPTTGMGRGIFGLGNPQSDELALRWVLKHSLGVSSTPKGAPEGESSAKIGGAVVVYGSGIDVLAAVGGLIKNNIPPTLISLVIPGTELEELGHGTVCIYTCLNMYIYVCL
jgi:hypothetical protein